MINYFPIKNQLEKFKLKSKLEKFTIKHVQLKVLICFNVYSRLIYRHYCAQFYVGKLTMMCWNNIVIKKYLALKENIFVSGDFKITIKSHRWTKEYFHWGYRIFAVQPTWDCFSWRLEPATKISKSVIYQKNLTHLLEKSIKKAYFVKHYYLLWNFGIFQ